MTIEKIIEKNKKTAEKISTKMMTSPVEKDLEKISVQELIAVIQKAVEIKNNVSVEQSFINQFEFCQKYLVEKVSKLEKFYYFVDKITNCPYLSDDDDLYCFSQKEIAEYAQDYFLQHLRNWEIKSVETDEIVNFLSDCYNCFGAKSFIIDNGANYIRLEIEKFGVQEDKENFYNAKYFNTLLKLDEEIYWRAMYPEKVLVSRQKENNMIIAFNKANLIVPYKKDTQEYELFTKNEKSAEESHIPVFTDMKEFSKTYKKEDYELKTFNSKELKEIAKFPLVVNPGTICFGVSLKMLSQLVMIYETELKK